MTNRAVGDERRERLQGWLAERGQDQGWLAAELEVSDALVSRIFSGERRISANFELRFLQRFGAVVAQRVLNMRVPQ